LALPLLHVKENNMEQFMKKLILLSLTSMFIFSSVSVFACGDGESNEGRASVQVESSDDSSSNDDSSVSGR
jgi:hypothetical protein